MYLFPVMEAKLTFNISSLILLFADYLIPFFFGTDYLIPFGKGKW